MRKALGAYSAGGTYALLTFLGAFGGGLQVLESEFPRFITGNITSIDVTKGTPLDMLSLAAATATVALPVVTIIAFFIWALLPKLETIQGLNLFENRKQTGKFSSVMQVIIFEEFLARYLFLTVIPMIIVQWRGPGAFMPLFLVGNGIWALLHAFNHQDGHPLRTAPQFVAGFFFGYMYLKYGFTGALIAHFTFDCVLWATDKVQEWNVIELLKILFHGLVFLIAWRTFGVEHMGTLTKWLTEWNPSTMAIPGWHLVDYICFQVMISSGFKVATNLLAFDEPGLPAYSKESWSLLDGCVTILLLPIGLAMLFGSVWILYTVVGLFTQDLITRVLWIAILFAFSQTSVSLSAMSNVWFSTVPLLFVSFCTLEAIGWSGYLAFCLALIVVDIPSVLLQQLDT